MGGTILGTTNRGNPFAHKTTVNGKEIVEDMSPLVLANIKELGLDCIVVIGGDGSLKIGHGLYKLGVPVIGVPKTIDNDLGATYVTFGFQTAVDTATEALDKLHTTAESHQRVIVLELMGRYAGWIALEAGIAGSADVILIPEIPFKWEKVAEKLLERKKSGSKSSIVVVAEGAKPEGGEMAVREKASDGYVLRLGGMGEIVGSEIAKRTGVDVRVTVLGHLQRGGSPDPFDRLLATRYGAYAAELIAQKKFGHMVSWQPRAGACRWRKASAYPSADDPLHTLHLRRLWRGPCLYIPEGPAGLRFRMGSGRSARAVHGPHGRRGVPDPVAGAA
jgi:6-phosphofructokinase